MPIFDYECLDCGKTFEVVVISRQSQFQESSSCQFCNSANIKKIISKSPTIRYDGRVALQTLPDPSPPLQELRGKNRPGCEGGFQDLPEVGKMERRRRPDGNWEWYEVKKQYFDMGKRL